MDINNHDDDNDNNDIEIIIQHLTFMDGFKLRIDWKIVTWVRVN